MTSTRKARHEAGRQVITVNDIESSRYIEPQSPPATPTLSSSACRSGRPSTSMSAAASASRHSLSTRRHPDQGRETSVCIWLWQPAPTLNSSTSGSSTFTRTPLLREVPQVRRKLTKKSEGYFGNGSGGNGNVGTTESGSRGLSPGTGETLGGGVGAVGGLSLGSGSAANVTDGGSGDALENRDEALDRQAHQLLSPLEAPTTSSTSEIRAFASLKSATPSWLKEKPSRTRLAGEPAKSKISYEGTWRRATAILRDDGVLAILTEDHAMVHSILTHDLWASDIRTVDPSLFGRLHVLGVFARPSGLHQAFRGTDLSKSAPHDGLSDVVGLGARQGPRFGARRGAGGDIEGVGLSSAGKASGVGDTFGSMVTGSAREDNISGASGGAAIGRMPLKPRDEPIYLTFGSRRSLCVWKNLLRTFAKPEIYGPLKPTPREVKELKMIEGTHRIHRKIDLMFHDIKLVPSTLGGAVEPGSLSIDKYSIAIEETKADADLLSLMEDGDATEASFNGRPSIDTLTNTPLGEVLLERPPASEDGHQDEERSGIRFSSDSDIGSNESDGSAYLTGPISGISGADRWKDTSPLGQSRGEKGLSRHVSPPPKSGGVAEVPISTTGLILTPSSYQPPHNSLAVSPLSSTFQCFVHYGESVAARTGYTKGNGDDSWLEKVSLTDLPSLADVYISIWRAGRNGKRTLLGTSDVAVETMRRGEVVQGCFPIWSHPRAMRHDETNKSAKSKPHSSSYDRILVGEVNLDVTVIEEVILPLNKYEKLVESINTPHWIQLVHDLGESLEENKIIQLLVQVYISQGTITQRLAELCDVEGEELEKLEEVQLLFRGNSLLSRAMDAFQRKCCLDWLDHCIGPTVRRICQERIWLDAETMPAAVSYESIRGVNSEAVFVQRSQMDTLKRLCSEIWSEIYSSRHCCPFDLRKALRKVRETVDARFLAQPPPGPGMQAVGAFVFLRLICPSIRAPQLFGLTPAKPDEGADRTLSHLSKVMLAMANKNLDKDKDSWLVQAQDFLNATAHEYNDFIDDLSLTQTCGGASPTADPSKGEIHKHTDSLFGDDVDVDFQDFVESRLLTLKRLHRESIPRKPPILNKSEALSTLVSYVIRNAYFGHEPESEDRSTYSRTEINSLDDRHAIDDATFKLSSKLHHSTSIAADALSRLHEFFNICCDVEDSAGFYIDRAGLSPLPLERGPDGDFATCIALVTAPKAYSGIRSDADADSGQSTGWNGRRLRSATVSATGHSSDKLPAGPGFFEQRITPNGGAFRLSKKEERRKAAERFSWRRSSDFSKSGCKSPSRLGHSDNQSRSSVEEEGDIEEDTREGDEGGGRGSAASERAFAAVKYAQAQCGHEDESRQVLCDIEAIRRAGAVANERKRWWKRK